MYVMGMIFMRLRLHSAGGHTADLMDRFALRSGRGHTSKHVDGIRIICVAVVSFSVSRALISSHILLLVGAEINNKFEPVLLREFSIPKVELECRNARFDWSNEFNLGIAFSENKASNILKQCVYALRTYFTDLITLVGQTPLQYTELRSQLQTG